MENLVYRCLNCGYCLVLLEKRAKYKCAKCGKLFFKKEVEDKHFREFNIKKRLEDKKEAKKAYRREYYSNKNPKKEPSEANKEMTKETYNLGRRNYYHTDLSYQSHLNRMRYWRRQQVKLALNE